MRKCRIATVTAAVAHTQLQQGYLSLEFVPFIHEFLNFQTQIWPLFCSGFGLPRSFAACCTKQTSDQLPSMGGQAGQTNPEKSFQQRHHLRSKLQTAGVDCLPSDLDTRATSSHRHILWGPLKRLHLVSLWFSNLFKYDMWSPANILMTLSYASRVLDNPAACVRHRLLAAILELRSCTSSRYWQHILTIPWIIFTYIPYISCYKTAIQINTI